MNDAERSTEEHCSECGAPLEAGVQRCWLCDRPRDGAQASIPPVVIVPRREESHFSYSLGSMMLVITLICVCLGLFGIAPGLGIIFAIIVTPAFIRTALGAARRKVEGRPMDVGQKIIAFGGSVGVVTVIGVAAGSAFFATCFASGWAALFGLFGLEVVSRSWWDPDATFVLAIGTGIVLGILTGGYVGYRLIRRLWPRKG